MGPSTLATQACCTERASRATHRSGLALGAAVVATLLVCGEARAQDACLTFRSKWGEAGAGPGQLNHPFGVNVDQTGNFYVADGNNHRIQKFTSTGDFLTEWGSFGRGPGQFNVPIDALVDRDGNVYVSDLLNRRIQKFTSSGTFLTQWGGAGSSPGKFTGPLGLALDASENIWVADTGGNGRIQVFTNTGIFLFTWGAFIHVTSVVLDQEDNVYVASSGDDTIKKFTTDGTLLTEWGSPGNGPGQFENIVEVIVDPNGDLYVSDQGPLFPNIQKFTNTGSFLGRWGSAGSGDGQFSGIFGLALDQAGHLFAADGSPFSRVAPNNNRIQEFSTACPVGIDIKPGSVTNRIQPFSAGVIPVAILGSEDLDVYEIDVETLAFGPGGASPTGNKAARLKDVNADGFLDLLTRYQTGETGLALGDTEACLSGKLVNGTLFEGCDAIDGVPTCASGPGRNSRCRR